MDEHGTGGGQIECPGECLRGADLDQEVDRIGLDDPHEGHGEGRWDGRGRGDHLHVEIHADDQIPLRACEHVTLPPCLL
jgi:hypothetical protein